MTLTTEQIDRLRCPGCGGELQAGAREMACPVCSRAFPVVAGIPDLRLEFVDPYVSWEDDLAQASVLEARFDELDFAGLVRELWRMSGKPAALAERFLAGELASRGRSEAYLAAVEDELGRALEPGDRFLEFGCGTAGMAAAAAARGVRATASDVAMRWMVLARKRLWELGHTDVALVCCAAEHAPFAPEAFDVVAASDVIEHVARPEDFVAACHDLLRPGGMLFLATPNRYSLGLEPHVRLWGVGFLPLPLARRYVRAVRKAPYDHVRLLSARQLRRLLGARGLATKVVAPEIPRATVEIYSGAELRAVRAYNRLRRLRAVRTILLAIGPFFHVFATKQGR
jgi:2-polyprenyl-3-methyl-5-hydroxy-6-metoxy-1,4-benzoquinol methylase/uncharacterized protein YbaR (Trm112 family)